MRRIYPTVNQVKLYRKRMGFRQTQVARLLGYRDSSVLSHFESGQKLPSLVDALRLGVILRVPIEFLFPALYEGIRQDIRAREERAQTLHH